MAKAEFSVVIVGTVQPDGDAIVSIRLHGLDGRSMQLSAVVDTGFNDSLTLTHETISALGLSARGEGRYTLADGSEAVTRLFAVEVDWLGDRRRTLAAQMDGFPLIGMSLLHGCRLTVNVIDGGRVEIRTL